MVSFINPERKQITIVRENFYDIMGKSEKVEMVQELDQNCDAHLTLDITNDQTGFCLQVIKEKTLLRIDAEFFFLGFSVKIYE